MNIKPKTYKIYLKFLSYRTSLGIRNKTYFIEFCSKRTNFYLKLHFT